MATGEVKCRRVLKKRFEYPYTNIGANNGRLTITAEDIGYTIPDGFTALGFPVLLTGSAGVFCQSLIPNATGRETFATLMNTNTSAKSGTFAVEMTFIPIGEDKYGRWVSADT